MKKIVALLVLIGLSTVANADAFSFNINAGDNLGIGSIITDTTGLATSGSLTMSSGSVMGIYDLFSGGGSPTYSPSNRFIFNNKTYNSAAVDLDIYGLLFVGNGLEINIWGNGTGNPYSFWSWNGSSYNINSNTASFSLAPANSPMGVQAVPVPAAIWLFGSAIIGLLGMSKKKQGNILFA
jgi:hypothetical protein